VQELNITPLPETLRVPDLSRKGRGENPPVGTRLHLPPYLFQGGRGLKGGALQGEG